MHGNVYQRCQDWYEDYPKNDAVDPQGSEKGNFRLIRGGSWCDRPDFCRSALRNWFGPGVPNINIGFRLCFSVE
jgi:formylglycine-generating enzyme required for sulfatase activity